MVNQGYKQTEVAMISEDWEIMTLADVCCKNGIVRGPFGGALKKEIFVSDGYKVYEQGNAIYRSVTRGQYFIDANKYNEMLRFAVNSGDFIVSCSGTIGMIYQIPNNAPKGIINQALLKLTVDKTIVDSNYFYLYFSWEDFNKRITDDTQGGAIKNLVSMELFKKTWLLLPTLPEQKRIAEALSDVDRMISSLEKLIVKKKAVKQGVRQELLTGKKRLPGFTGEWEDYTIGKMGEFYSGLSGKSKKDFDCGDAYYITFLNVLSNVKINTSILASVDVRENESQNAVRKGDLFFNTSSETPEEVGMCAVLDEIIENTYLNSFCFGFRLFDDTHNPLFLSYYLNSSIGRKIMSVLAQGATRYNLSKNNFAETIIKLPTKEEQTAIASILSDMDNEIEALEQKLAKARQVKQGMMQQLLTGKIRLV